MYIERIKRTQGGWVALVRGVYDPDGDGADQWWPLPYTGQSTRAAVVTNLRSLGHEVCNDQDYIEPLVSMH